MIENQRKYSFHPIINQNCKIIILGTLPSAQSLQKNQFYGNIQNHFWRIIYSLFQTEIQFDYSKKQSFLLSNKIALWDVIHSAYNINSLDSNIKKENPNDFNWLFSQYKNIAHIFFNGTKSESIFKKYFLTYYNTIPHTLLPSSSPIPNKNIRNLEQKLKSWSAIADQLNKFD